MVDLNNKKDVKYPTSVHMKVAEVISTLAPSVEEAVVDILVDREKKRRATAIVQVFDKRDSLLNDLNKIRPKNDRFTEEGKPIGEPSFNKDDIEKRKKLKDQIVKCENAINKAIEKQDYSDVYNLSSGKNTEEGTGT